jgi:hypothetical protein
MKSWKLGLLSVGVIVTSASCHSAPSKPCTGNIAGPRLISFGPAALPSHKTPIPGESVGAIIGSVADSENGRGIDRATVVLRADSSSTVLSEVTTDSIGGFVMRDVRPGRYFLTATGVTYAARSVHVNIAPGKLDTVQTTLRFNARSLLCNVITTM